MGQKMKKMRPNIGHNRPTAPRRAYVGILSVVKHHSALAHIFCGIGHGQA
jgi:hypothetical protein